MLVTSVASIAVFRGNDLRLASSKWVVESAFEICAIIGLVASITAAIPIFDATAADRQRQGVIERIAVLRAAPTRCEGLAPTACCQGAISHVIDTFHASEAGGAVETDGPEAWRAFRETLQQETQRCAQRDVAMRDLVRSVNAYTKSVSDHASYGAVRSSLSWLNDVKASVLFTICLIFYLCQAIGLKLIKAIWLGRPD